MNGQSATAAGGILPELQMAVEHHQAGRLSQAEHMYRQVLQREPNQADALHLLGQLHLQQGNVESAVELISQAIKVEPSREHYHFNLGNAQLAAGCLEEAARSYRQALQIKPDYVEAQVNLGNAFQAQGRLDEAIASYQQALLLKPDFAEAYCNLGNIFQAQGLRDEAIACFRQTLLIRPDYADGYNNLGAALQAQCRLDEAVACYRQALLITPDFIEAYCNLGNVLQVQGKLDEAVASYRQALLIKPNYHEAHSNLIFTMDQMVGNDIATLQSERRRWSGRYADGLYGVPVFSNAPVPERRLRIGYVSADFRHHSASGVFGTMLTCFDPAAFDIFAYSNSVIEDEHTRFFQKSVTCWRKISGLTDADAAELIRKDEIDILVDLSGYTAGNRLLVFARKPAPIQITAWGYIGGTGMKAMDVFFADSVVVPPEEKPLYAEEVRYLPNVISAYFSNPFPGINDLPAKGRELTFGSFNRLCKISAEAYQVWARVLQAIPGSRMLLKTVELDSPGTRALVLERFSHAGIDPARIALYGNTTWAEHMAAFNQIDLSLDPFPHGGGVTTLEGLMMGVPVVTLRWPTIPGRLSASILTTLGLTDWIAESPEQYVEIAVEKAQNLTALAELRQQLRPHFMASIIGDTAAYARVVEQEYRKLWREWCLRSGIPQNATDTGKVQEVC